MIIASEFIESPCPACGHPGFHVMLSRKLDAGTELIATCACCGVWVTEDVSDEETWLWEAASKPPTVH